MEGEDGILNGLSENKIWLEMSTTDESEVKRIGKKVIEKKAIPLDGPVSGGCHRAATGNIAIFVGGERSAFDKILPVLTIMGRKVLHTGELGSASILKVITNYLASVHLVALGEAWTVAKKSNLDLEKTFKGIAAPFNILNVDTDKIIPKQFLTTIKRTGLGKHVFDEMRYQRDGSNNPNFILNNFKYYNVP